MEKNVKKINTINNSILIGEEKGITLIALVVTIVVLIILAGISITMVLGGSGILNKSKDASNKTNAAAASEKVQMLLGDYVIEKHISETNLMDYMTQKQTEGEIDGITDNGDGTYEVEVDGYLVTIDADGKVIDVSKAGPRPQVSNIRVVSNPDGSGTSLAANSVAEGTTLYINFDSSIEGGTITSVNPTLPYAVTANGKTTFTVTGTIGSDTYTKTITVNVNQYDIEFKIGTYVRYGVSYTDAYTGYDFTTEGGRGWRVLDPGTDNGNGTYSNVKLISTGIPVRLYYNSYDISGESGEYWRGTTNQISDYISKFYSSSLQTNPNMYAVAGLYFNLDKIIFNKGTSFISNQGCFTKVNGKTSGSITGNEFITGNATKVHNLTMDEFNQARNKKAGANTFALNETDGTSSYSAVTTANDAATGLFYLRGLNSDYGYNAGLIQYYWLASPKSSYDKFIWYIRFDGRLYFDTYGDGFGVRPVVTLTSVSTSDIVGN